MSLFAFSFQFENALGLIAFIPCPSRKRCTAIWLCGQLQQQKRGRGTVEKMMWVGLWMCSYSILFPFFLLNKLPGSKRESGGEGGRREQLEWGDSLIRGVHADETYLGRPCVHEAPKLPVLKHWLAVSSVSFAWIRKGCCAFHLI